MKTKAPKQLSRKLNRIQWDIARDFKNGKSLNAIGRETGVGIGTLEYIIQTALKFHWKD